MSLISQSMEPSFLELQMELGSRHDVNIESPPSMHPCKRICDITSFEITHFSSFVSYQMVRDAYDGNLSYIHCKQSCQLITSCLKELSLVNSMENFGGCLPVIRLSIEVHEEEVFHFIACSNNWNNDCLSIGNIYEMESSCSDWNFALHIIDTWSLLCLFFVSESPRWLAKMGLTGLIQTSPKE